MKEVVFLNRYKEKWKALEDALDKRSLSDPDRISEAFVQLTDDLSYARTFYPESKTTEYLNGLSIRLHQEIYRNKKENSSRFWRFWREEVPLTVGRHHPKLLVSFSVFVLSFAAGWLSSSFDDFYVRLVLGDEYVNQTLANIEAGKPMDIYGSMEEFPMFIYIAANNIFVSFKYFVFGLFFSVGSLFFLSMEGLRIGAFFQLFHSKGVITQALMAVWMHGTIEISIIVVACSAGVTAGYSYLFPGTYPRGVSFVRGMKDAVKIIIGLVPCFILAALIEGFATRHYALHPAFNLLIIGASLSFVLWYFVFYPLSLRRQTDSTSHG
jgi:uncharacterized membrane protein SpoIIM required for sporulation